MSKITTPSGRNQTSPSGCALVNSLVPSLGCCNLRHSSASRSCILQTNWRKQLESITLDIWLSFVIMYQKIWNIFLIKTLPKNIVWIFLCSFTTVYDSKESLSFFEIWFAHVFDKWKQVQNPMTASEYLPLCPAQRNTVQGKFFI